MNPHERSLATLAADKNLDCTIRILATTFLDALIHTNCKLNYIIIRYQYEGVDIMTVFPERRSSCLITIDYRWDYKYAITVKQFGALQLLSLSTTENELVEWLEQIILKARAFDKSHQKS